MPKLLRRADLAYCAAASVVLLAVTSAPYVYGYLVAPPDRWFAGVIYNVHDTAQYLSWMREFGSRVLIENRLTSEPNPALYFNLHWWIPGRVAAWFHLSLPAVYQLGRLAAVPFYVVVAYWCSGLFFADVHRRRFAFWLATLGSGLGWIWVVDKHLAGRAAVRFPTDVYTTPGNTFWVLLAAPHLALALALTLLAFGLAWVGHVGQRPRATVAAGVVTLFLGLGHVYDLVTIWAVLVGFAVVLTLRDGWRWPALRTPILVIALSAPAPLYFAWLSSATNPVWQRALAQFDNLGVFTPPPVHLAVLLGASFFLALGALARQVRTAWRRGPRALADRDLFVAVWLAAGLAVVYLPLHFQIMLLTGLQFAMAVLATDVVYDVLLPWLQERFARRHDAALRRWVPALILLAVVPTNVYLFAWRFLDLSRTDYPYYLHRDDLAALAWIEEYTRPDDVVLTAFPIGHYLPGLTGRRALLSNAVMTIDLVTKRTEVERFFQSATSDAERCRILTRHNIRYVLHGPAERALGAFDPAAASFLRPVFVAAQTRVFEVDAQKGCHLPSGVGM